jgi:hypothetical protein
MIKIATALAAGIALAPLAVLAQSGASTSTSYRCTGKDGKKYYGSTIPQACIGQPVEQLNAQGLVIKRIDAAASAADRAKKEADEEERKKREAMSKEEGRRNRALLATYTSEQEIDSARARALKGNEAAVKDIETRISGLKQRLAQQKKELQFYEGKNKPPAKLAQDIQSAEFDIKAQEDLLAAKRKEVEQINARFDDDKKRYQELTKGSSK